MVLICAANFAGACMYAKEQNLPSGEWTWVNEPEILFEYPHAQVVRTRHWDACENAEEIKAGLIQALNARLVRPDVIDA